MSLLRLKTGDPTPLTPGEFFSDVCPKVLSASAALCKRLGGSYAFQLFGAGGGAWTLDYAKSEVRDGADDAADLYVEMDTVDFAALLKGTLDVAAAAAAGRMRVTGDRALLSNLVAVLEPVEA